MALAPVLLHKVNAGGVVLTLALNAVVNVDLAAVTLKASGTVAAVGGGGNLRPEEKEGDRDARKCMKTDISARLQFELSCFRILSVPKSTQGVNPTWRAAHLKRPASRILQVPKFLQGLP